jgi:uncharacterized damage-inducible protein DinB
MSQGEVAALAAEVDRARRRLYALVRSEDVRSLTRRPASGAWSVLENVRHLVFAEQAHLGKFAPDGAAWSSVGLTERAGKALRAGTAFTVAGMTPQEDLEEVLRTWDAIHRPIRKALKTNYEAVHYALERHLKHLLRHIAVIKKLIAQQNT